MKCNACGREIPDQAQFCNYCGSKVIAKESPVSQPVQKSEAYAAPANHKTSGGFVVLIILLIIVMISGGFFLLRYVGTIDIYQKTESSIPFTSKSSQTANPSLTASCKYGALYKDGYLTYGLARLKMPGFYLLPGENGTGDYLVSNDQSVYLNCNLITYQQQISYEQTTKDSLLSSLRSGTMKDAQMIDCSKSYIDDYYVIYYYAKGTINGIEEYIGELIVFPSKNTKETMHFMMESLNSKSLDQMSQIIQSLDISSSYKLASEDTGSLSPNSITVK
ncbi:MAG: zinc ribbon domain-containing protein [Clostridia bacterium]|nr:zinc ribbon domain-containing protein [Clostridia bacterium]MBQ4157663.1 zinc ribbon domain-containing protein [Clostridia bacterium]